MRVATAALIFFWIGGVAVGIPEHDKCVKCHKWIRRNRQRGNWRKIRKIRRANGDMKPKERIRQMLKVEYLIQKSRHKNYKDFMKDVMGQHYRRYGKYDD